jgi:hypothetical protein
VTPKLTDDYKLLALDNNQAVHCSSRRHPTGLRASPEKKRLELVKPAATKETDNVQKKSWHS